MTQRVFAHQTLTSLLVTEVELEYHGDEPESVLVQRVDLAGEWPHDQFGWYPNDCPENEAPKW